MKKQTRKEKKAEEARVLAEMRAALEEAEREERGYTDTETETQIEKGKANTPQTQAPVYHCRRCKTAMQNGVCPTCGFKMYVPMDEKKLGKIKVVLTAIGMALFLVIFLYLQMKNG